MAQATDDVVAPPVLDAYSREGHELLSSLQSARASLASGAWGEAVRAVVQLNGQVMKRRGGAPWLKLIGSRLEVDLADDAAGLPSVERLRDQVWHSYYLDPFRQLVAAWSAGAG